MNAENRPGGYRLLLAVMLELATDQVKADPAAARNPKDARRVWRDREDARRWILGETGSLLSCEYVTGALGRDIDVLRSRYRTELQSIPRPPRKRKRNL